LHQSFWAEARRQKSDRRLETSAAVRISLDVTQAWPGRRAGRRWV